MQITMKLDLTGLNAIGEVVIAAVLPAAHHAVGFVAQRIETDWKESVLRAGGKGGMYAAERDAYANSISWRFESPLSAVVETDYKAAEEIENGRPARDLKKMLQTSQRTRTTKKGKKYLIIPFRHNTTGNGAHAKAMPKGIYAQAKALKPSSVTGITSRTSATGASVPQNTYKWGGRLPAGLSAKLQPHHKTDIHAGMVKMNTSSGGSKSSAYLTFRVMSESSTGWIIPARPGLSIVKGIVARNTTTAQQYLDKAIAASITS